MTAAERMRRTRARHRAGLKCVTVEFDDVELPQALIESGHLRPDQEDDLDAIAAAIERVLRLVTRNVAES